MKRVIVVANKWWECDPVLLAMLSDNARPQASSPWKGIVQAPRPRPNPKQLPPSLSVLCSHTWSPSAATLIPGITQEARAQ